ncbi:hypothetical protein BHM03_00033218, partial [Ensete ventricosum]
MSWSSLDRLQLMHASLVYHGHSMSDPGSTYRTRDEISGVRQLYQSAFELLCLLINLCFMICQDIEKEVRKEVDEAVAQAKECPMPDPSELFNNVYVKGYGAE